MRHTNGTSPDTIGACSGIGIVTRAPSGTLAGSFTRLVPHVEASTGGAGCNENVSVDHASPLQLSNVTLAQACDPGSSAAAGID